MVSAGTFGLYLYQNMSNFYGDIDDLADCLDIFSEQDVTSASLTFAECDNLHVYQQEELSGLICGYGVIETNMHVIKANHMY